MDTADLLKKIRKIEIKTKGITKNIFAGEYQSAFKGRGMEFSEVREYIYGDDIRNIDWNVTARFNEPYIKIFEEERELTVMLLIDVSGSQFFGSQATKNSIITEISAVLSFSAIQNNDKIGVIFFSDRIEKFIPPQKGRKHILKIIRELLICKPQSKKTDIAVALQYLNSIIKKRSTVFVISDFLSDNYFKPLQIARYKHDVIAIHIYDIRETLLPKIGRILLKDPETGENFWFNTSSIFARYKYMKWWDKHLEKLKKTLLKTGVKRIEVRTDIDYIKPLLKFFKQRM